MAPAPMYAPDVVARMAANAVVVRKQLQGARDFDKWVGLTGQRALCEPGQSVIIRLLPRWDFYGKRYRANASGGADDLTKAGLFFPEEPFFPCREHWYNNLMESGKRTRDWCRVPLAWCQESLGLPPSGENACPGCEESNLLLQSGVEAESKAGHDMRPQDVYLYNILIRGFEFDEQGQPDVRIFIAPSTVWLAITEICMGNQSGQQDVRLQQQFGKAKGDVADWVDGFDIQITRAGKPGERHSAVAADNPSTVFSPEQTAAHPGCWDTLARSLYVLPQELMAEIPDYVEMHRKATGLDPGARRATGSGYAAPPAAAVPGFSPPVHQAPVAPPQAVPGFTPPPQAPAPSSFPPPSPQAAPGFMPPPAQPPAPAPPQAPPAMRPIVTAPPGAGAAPFDPQNPFGGEFVLPPTPPTAPTQPTPPPTAPPAAAPAGVRPGTARPGTRRSSSAPRAARRK